MRHKDNIDQLKAHNTMTKSCVLDCYMNKLGCRAKRNGYYNYSACELVQHLQVIRQDSNAALTSNALAKPSDMSAWYIAMMTMLTSTISMTKRLNQVSSTMRRATRRG